MKKTHVPLFLILNLILFSGCFSTEATVNSEPFFDLKQYFKSEIKKLEKVTRVKKTVEINSQREEKEKQEINFTKELSAFSDADINRLAWKDKYRVDSITNNAGKLSALHYLATNEKMRTQSLYISFQNNAVDSIFVRNQINGFATTSNQEMSYVPKYGYTIQSYQRTLLGKERFVTVKVRYLD